jgi:inositol phosphorylceramide mannosyltransferase catalytic subunit
MKHVIPKRVIQIGKSQELPLMARISTATMRSLNPDFEYVYFDNEQKETFVNRYFPQYRKMYDTFPIEIQKYDFFRYLAVYRLGGFYFDLDVFLAKGLHDLSAHGCVFSFEELSLHRFLRDQFGMDWEVANYGFGASAGHPFIGAIIENCVKAKVDRSWAEVMWRPIPRLFRKDFYVLDTTGPGLVSRTLAEFPHPASQIKVLFPPDVCDASNWHKFGDYGAHLQEGTWRTRKAFWHRKLSLIWETHTRAAFLRESLAKGPHRSLEFRRPT